MMSKMQLGEIAARNQKRPNEDVTTLLAEVHELRNGQIQVIRWIGRHVVPKLKKVRRYLLYLKPMPRRIPNARHCHREAGRGPRMAVAAA